MKTIFRKVSVKDRLPNEDGEYITNYGSNTRLLTCNHKRKWTVQFGDTVEVTPNYWLEEVELPTDKEIDNTFPLQYGMDILNFNTDTRKGAKWMRDNILGKQ